MTRLWWLLLLTPVMAGCSDDPEHGAWKYKSGVWLLFALVLLVAVSVRRVTR